MWIHECTWRGRFIPRELAKQDTYVFGPNGSDLRFCSAGSRESRKGKSAKGATSSLAMFWLDVCLLGAKINMRNVFVFHGEKGKERRYWFSALV